MAPVLLSKGVTRATVEPFFNGTWDASFEWQLFKRTGGKFTVDIMADASRKTKEPQRWDDRHCFFVRGVTPFDECQVCVCPRTSSLAFEACSCAVLIAVRSWWWWWWWERGTKPATTTTTTTTRDVSPCFKTSGTCRAVRTHLGKRRQDWQWRQVSTALCITKVLIY